MKWLAVCLLLACGHRDVECDAGTELRDGKCVVVAVVVQLTPVDAAVDAAPIDAVIADAAIPDAAELPLVRPVQWCERRGDRICGDADQCQVLAEIDHDSCVRLRRLWCFLGPTKSQVCRVTQRECDAHRKTIMAERGITVTACAEHRQ